MDFNENVLKNLCEEYGFTYHMTTTYATIKTVCANWRFDYTETPYKLFHKPSIIHNYFVAINTNDGYHDQKRSFNNLKDLIDYIYTHDKDYFIKPKYKQEKKKKK